jgi:DNA polymerase-3 subunit alpha
MFENFEEYKDYEPIGVALPQVSIDEKYYKELSLDQSVSNEEFLRALMRKGVFDRGIDKKENKGEYFDRCIFELNTFIDTEIIDYILILWDFLNWCREENIPIGAGRGSAAGSLVFYLLGITGIDPIKENLFFERFLSKSRVNKVGEVDGLTFLEGALMPDVDCDISFEHREKVIEYIENKYSGRTAKILTFNTFSSKLCAREAAKYFLDAKEEEANAISDSIPKIHGRVMSLGSAIDEEKFGDWARDNKEVYQNALKVEDLNKNCGVHPAGLAISHGQIDHFVPLQKTKEGEIVGSYDMDDISDLTVKFDLLGLRTLSVAHTVCEEIGISLDEIDPNDTFIYQTLQDLKYPMGLFQISADTNFRVCQKTKPMNLGELSDVLAIGRPGALQFLDTYVSQKACPDPLGMNEKLDEILSWSKNVILYQEQLMFIANQVFGLSLEEAEILRRIVGKKKVSEMPVWKDKIFEAGSKKGLDDEVAEYYWSALSASADYSFNRSHSISYADLAAKTVYLKFKYPQIFYTCLLNSAKDEPDPLEAIGKITREVEDFGIKVLKPSVEKSQMHFSVEGENIRYGLQSIKGVSDKSLEALIEFRGEKFNNKYEIFEGAEQSGINITILSALIYAGAIDSGTSSRARVALESRAWKLLTKRERGIMYELGEEYSFDILNALNDCIENKRLDEKGKPIMKESRFETFKKKFAPQKKLFEENKKFSKLSTWYFEDALLGYSPTLNLIDCFSKQDELLTIREASELGDGENFRCVVKILEFQKRISRNDRRYLRFSCYDDTGSVNMMFFEDDYGRLEEFMASKKLNKKSLVFARGTRVGDDAFFVDNIKVLEDTIYLKASMLPKK